MSFCAICRLESAKRNHQDLLHDKIGEPAITLGELLMKIINDTDYQLASTSLCKKCTRKIGRYYKSIQEAEQIQLEILELLKNQKNLQNYSNHEEDGTKDEEKTEFEHIEAEIKIEELSDMGKAFAEELPQQKCTKSLKTNCSLPDKTSILAETPMNITTSIKKESSVEHENPLEMIPKKRGRPKKDTKIDTPIKKAQYKKKTKPVIKKGIDIVLNNDKKYAVEDSNIANDKKAVDCSATEGTYIYHTSQRGPPIGIHCKTCDHLFKNPKTFHAHKRYNGFTGYICETCGIQCLTKIGIREHTKMHNPDKEFKCDRCGAEFHKRETFKRHMAVHKGETPYKCEVCSKRFLYQAALCNHRIIHDESTRRFHCKLCEKKFRSVSHLRRHMAIHTGAKPFSCPVCGNRFSQAYNMKAHMKLHDSEQTNKTVSRNLCCQKCFEDFECLLEYQNHVKSCP